ncbi:MAG: eCIS core domain-containing protein, partial [Flavisolibacter sp.]
MFKSSSEKTNTHAIAVQKKAAGTAFFRKAGEESFFGEKSAPAFFNPSIQTKLSVSSPDDPQEKEADAVADRVMRMADPAPVASEEKKEEVQRKEEENPVNGESEIINPSIQCKEEKQKEKEEEKIQTKLNRKIYRSAEEHETIADSDSSSVETYNVNRKEISIHHSDVIQRSGRGPPQNSIQFGQTLSASKGGGNEMPGDTRQFMESRFNADFSGVKIHTGSTAETLSNTIHAQAFTHGNDIYFNSSKFSPNTADGGSLLAHELTHTIQQGASQ